ncbi:MAG: DUF2335 domain-containing protein [Verrucomicrobiota bacterium]|nr:DUF2335 domain-containing protein [Verrucomicrobiota bacterium]
MAKPIVRQQTRQQIQQVEFQQQFYSGPLPQATDLKAYGEIAPEFPLRILAMAEKEQAHRHREETKYGSGERWIAGIGQVFGFIIALSLIASSFWLLMHDKSISGYTAMIAGMVTLIGPFLARRKNERALQRPG